jgi:hypothetical protein
MLLFEQRAVSTNPDGKVLGQADKATEFRRVISEPSVTPFY